MNGELYPAPPPPRTHEAISGASELEGGKSGWDRPPRHPWTWAGLLFGRSPPAPWSWSSDMVVTSGHSTWNILIPSSSRLLPECQAVVPLQFQRSVTSGIWGGIRVLQRENRLGALWELRLPVATLGISKLFGADVPTMLPHSLFWLLGLVGFVSATCTPEATWFW